MTIVLAIVAAVAVLLVLFGLARLAPGRTESVRSTSQPAADRQGEELTPRDHAA